MNIEASINELHSAKLFLYLQRQNQDYADRATSFVRAVTPILATIKDSFPLYTRHDAHHGFKVTERISQVVNPICFLLEDEKSLKPAELFLLIAAAYSHDLGMAVFPGEEEELKNKFSLTGADWKVDDRLTNYLRTEHSKRGGIYILKNSKRLSVPDSLVDQLDLMMKSHNMHISELENNLRGPFAVDERIIDLRQLASILCIGDAIEFSATRVHEGVIDLAKSGVNPSDRVSYEENRKHECIGGNFAIDDAGQVVVNGTFTEPEVLAKAHRALDEMEGWIRGYCDIDRASKLPRLRILSEPFRRRLELPGFKFERLGVRMSKRSVIDLIASNSVWRNNPGVPVRELIQNAVEACRYRQHRSSPADNYDPHVRVVFNRENRTISVNDNGCGMSERTVLNNFLTVGSSRSKEPDYYVKNYAPIARFGIGFWSVFTISEVAHVETNAFEGSAGMLGGFSFDVALEEIKDYTVFKTMAIQAGTKVTLFLKKDVVVDDVFDRLKNELLSTAIKLTLTFDDEELIIPESVPEVTPVHLLGVRESAAKEKGMHFFDWRGQAGDTELAMGFVYRMENGIPTFRVNENQSVSSCFEEMRSIRFIRTAICGFITTSPRQRTCFALERVGYAHANCRSPKGFEFSLDRQALVENDAQITLSNDIVDLVHEGYRAFLKSKNVYTPRVIHDLNEGSELSGGNVYDTYTGQELSEARKRSADLLCFQLWPIYPNHSLSQVEPVYVNLEDLLTMGGECWLIQTSFQVPLGNGQISHMSAEQLVPFGYEIVSRNFLKSFPHKEHYFLAANRPASMLFDSDPASSIAIGGIKVPGGQIIQCTLQRLNLSNVRLDSNEHDILVEVKGPWSGAVYCRDFIQPNNKPYVFLGRYRVLVQRNSKLLSHLTDLKSQGKTMKIANLIVDLREDEAGYAPASLQGLI